MKILVVEDESEMRELLSFALENSLQAEILQTDSGNAAIELVKSTPNIDVIVSDYAMPNGNGGTLFQFLEHAHSKIPFILCSSNLPSDHVEFSGQSIVGFLQKPFQIDVLEKMIHELKIKSTKPAILPEYFKIKAHVIFKLKTIAVDLFVKVSDKNFVKLFNKDDVITEEDFGRFSIQHSEYLYFRRNDFRRFTEKLAQGISGLSSLRTPQSAYETAVASHELALEIISTLGITPEISAIIKSSVNLAQDMIREGPSLKELFESAMNKPEEYTSSHSILLGYVAPSLASLIGWNSSDTFLKLSIAAFLHDIQLRNPELAKISNLSDVKKLSAFTSEEIRIFENHPYATAQLAKTLPEMPEELDIIIAEHHERPNGSGFPAGLRSLRINPLSCVFIVAEDLVNRLLNSKNTSVSLALNAMAGEYQDGLFKKLIKAAMASVK